MEPLAPPPASEVATAAGGARSRAVPALTGLRPFASGLVFAYHFCRPLATHAPSWLRELLDAGNAAVSVFFVLSGFVLAIGNQDALRAGMLRRGRFLRRGLARIYPAHIVAIVALLPLAFHSTWGAATGAFPPATAQYRVGTLALHLLLAQAWAAPVALSWNHPAWSISVELACYLLFCTLATHL